MLNLLRDLLHHKAFADAAILQAIRRHPAAAADAEFRTRLHHIVVSNRYWIWLNLGLHFDLEKERTIPDSLEGIAALFQEVHSRELDWISKAHESDLTRPIGAMGVSVVEALMQVCLHSQGHRAQCVMRLREMGGTPPSGLDFVIWLRDRGATIEAE
jgi:uncharacterized damage-inducible protein DinB